MLTLLVMVMQGQRQEVQQAAMSNMQEDIAREVDARRKQLQVSIASSHWPSPNYNSTARLLHLLLSMSKLNMCMTGAMCWCGST